MPERPFLPLSVATLTVSDSRTPDNDPSGDLLEERVRKAGHRIIERALAPDDIHEVRARVSAWLVHPEVEIILTTGGTGVTGRDGTPEAVAVLLDKRIDGFGEMFRALSHAGIGASALQSRALAGVANGRYIFCLPGSPGACRDAWDGLIEKQLDFRTRPCNLAELLPRLREK